MKKMEDFCEWNTVSLWERRMDKTMNSKKCSRENWKVLKTVLEAQNMRFSRLNWVVNKSPGQVAKHLRDKIFEKLSKCFLWLEGPPASKLRRDHENFCITSWLELRFANKSSNQVARTVKTQNFGKFSKSFSRLGHWPASESRKPTVKGRD